MYWFNESSKQNGSSRQVEFYCDTVADIANLPTSQRYGVKQDDDNVSNEPVDKGSTCLCIGSSSLYILNSSDNWVEI